MTAESVRAAVKALEEEVQAVCVSSAKLKVSLQALQAEALCLKHEGSSVRRHDTLHQDVVKSVNQTRPQIDDRQVEKSNGDSGAHTLTSDVALPEVLERRWAPRKNTEQQAQRADITRSSSMQKLSIGTITQGPSVKLKMYGFWEEVHAKSGSAQMPALDSVVTSKPARRVSAFQEFLSQDASSLYRKLDDAIKEPYSGLHIAYSVIGLFLLILDAITMPVAVAWDEYSDDPFLVAIFFASVPYWLLDMAITLQTGYTEKGKLVINRYKMARRYMSTWFVPDLAVFLVDITVLITLWLTQIRNSNDSVDSALLNTRWARMLRFLRLVRLARLVKFKQIEEKIDVVVGYSAMQYVELFAVVVKTFAILVLFVHLLGCFWFLIGRTCQVAGMSNWLKEYEFDSKTFGAQYLVCVHWVFAQITPAPMRVQPTNEYEQGYNLFVLLFALLVVGGSISRISNTIQQVLKLQGENNIKRRAVSQYLKHNEIDMELSTRVLAFVDHKLGKRKTAMLDTSLITERMRKELHMKRRGPTLLDHFLFRLMNQAFKGVFVEVCDSLKVNMLEQGECILKIATVSECMYIVPPGRYLVDDTLETYEDTMFLAEISLFAPFVHQVTVQCQVFVDLFTLDGKNFAECTSGNPACGAFVYQYARSLLNQVHQAKISVLDNVSEEIRYEACRVTNCYQVLHLDDGTKLHNFSIECCPGVDEDVVEELLKQVASGVVDAGELQSKLEEMFPELLPDTGTHARYSQPAERKRALACLISTIYLIADRYEDFVRPQDQDKQLSRETWQALQEFVEWSGIRSNPDWIYCVLVFLAIKGLGKSETLLLQVPSAAQGPESALLYAMEYTPRLMPSVVGCFPNMRKMLLIHKDFNLGQFLQAENSAASVDFLRLADGEDGGQEEVRASLVAAFGLMCGILGSVGDDAHLGSKFMDKTNSVAIIMSLRCLQRLGEYSCQEVYWGYIMLRAQQLAIPVDSLEDVAFARLACLCRVQRPADLDHLASCWKSLDNPDRLILVENFLADGIYESGILFLYLPFCLAHAKANEAVGLTAMLLQLVELIMLARGRMGQSGRLITINLQDLYQFTAQVKSAAVFESFLEHVEFVDRDSIIFLNMSSDNWSRVDDTDVHAAPVSSSLRRLSRKQCNVQKVLDTLQGEMVNVQGALQEQHAETVLL